LISLIGYGINLNNESNRMVYLNFKRFWILTEKTEKIEPPRKRREVLDEPNRI